METDSLYWVDATSLWCSTEGTLGGLFVSPAALQCLLPQPLCFQKALPFCELRFAFFVLMSLRAISERIGNALFVSLGSLSFPSGHYVWR